jgi:hypothetical protein
MTEAQYITLILGFAATNATALVALLINNSRLTDTRMALKAEIETSAAQIEARTAASREAILSQMATYQLDIISKIAELDNRITRLER